MKLQGSSRTPSMLTALLLWEMLIIMSTVAGSRKPCLLVLMLTGFMLRKPFSQKYAVNGVSHKAGHYDVEIKDTETDSQLSIRKSI